MRTAKQVTAKIVALMVADWQSAYEISGVTDVDHGGQSVTLVDTRSEEEYEITVYRRSTAPAVEAKVDREDNPF